MAVIATQPAAGTGQAARGSGAQGSKKPRDRRERTTPGLLRSWTAASTLAVCALLAVSVAAFGAARGDAATVSGRAAVAERASDLYFALADLDAQGARLVLLGDGDLAPGDSALGGDQLAALTGYNASAAQADADLLALIASADSQDKPALSALTSGMTRYHDLASSAVTLVAVAGSPAGQSTPAAIGYYGLAATLLENIVLPQAAALRESTAATASGAASDARRTALIAVIALAVLGIVALLFILRTHRLLTRRFRRLFNPGLVAAGLLVVGLVLGEAAGLAAVGSDAGTASARFAGYLAVARTRADSYAADGDLSRAVLIVGTDELGPWQSEHHQQTPLDAAISRVNRDVAALGPGGAGPAAAWRGLSGTDMTKIVQAAQSGDVVGSLALDTGTHRGQAAFDFSTYDTGLQSLAAARLASFHQATAEIDADLSGWSWLPWLLCALALALMFLGVRPRLAEFR